MSFHLDIDEKTASSVLDSETTGIYRYIEHPYRILDNAYRTWLMVAPEKAAKLDRVFKDDLGGTPGESEVRLHRNQIERLVEALKGIETVPVGIIMDEHYRVLPDKIAYVNENAPGLAILTTDGQGNPLYVLHKITEIEWLRAFLETALELNCDILVG